MSPEHSKAVTSLASTNAASDAKGGFWNFAAVERVSAADPKCGHLLVTSF